MRSKVKDCNFRIVPISGIINNEELNPFENFTVLRRGDSGVPKKFKKPRISALINQRYHNQMQNAGTRDSMRDSPQDKELTDDEYFFKHFNPH